MNIRRRHFVRGLAVAGLGGGALLHAGAVLPGDAKPAPTPWPPSPIQYERSVRNYTIPDVVLIDADGRPVRLREALAGDDPVMLNFIFTTCSTICPIMVRVFADVPPRLGSAAKNLRLISISIDPENDTPARLKTYAQTFGEGMRWRFLTGRAEDINTVQRAFGTFKGDKMNHEPLTLMRQAAGKSWVRLDGFANPDQLVVEYRKLTAN
jgi:protein SCO1/2